MGSDRNILFVGSVGLPDVETVFQSLGRSVGGRAARFPDGECGPRSHWINWQLQVIESHACFEVGESFEMQFGGSVRRIDKYRIVEGVDPDSIEFDSLGYAKEAIASYEIFQRMKKQGDVPEGTRFQISLPTPIAVSTAHFVASSQHLVEPAYERALKREIDTITKSIPLDDLAMQWDVCQEVLAASGAWDVFFDDPLKGALDRLERLASYIPEPSQLGFHLCYGDPGHKHIAEPDDLDICVKFANGLSSRITRLVNWIHMPVPRDRTDDDYFAPLDNLKLNEETELYLGLVHMTDGVKGAEQRIAAAVKHAANFGIATECGFGRREPETISDLLDLHVEIAAL